jgi:hypothetical protein
MTKYMVAFGIKIPDDLHAEDVQELLKAACQQMSPITPITIESYSGIAQQERLYFIEMQYHALYNTELDPEDFATEFFYMVGELLNGKGLDELRPGGPAAGTLKELLVEQRREEGE